MDYLNSCSRSNQAEKILEDTYSLACLRDVYQSGIAPVTVEKNVAFSELLPCGAPTRPSQWLSKCGYMLVNEALAGHHDAMACEQYDYIAAFVKPYWVRLVNSRF